MHRPPPDHHRPEAGRTSHRQRPRLTTGQLTARIRRLCIDADPERAQRSLRQGDLPTAGGERTHPRRHRPPVRPGPPSPTGWPPSPPHQPCWPAVCAQPPSRAPWTNSAPTSPRPPPGSPDRRAPRPRSGRHPAVDLNTLTELADHPGDLAGYGPVIADIARQVTASQTRPNGGGPSPTPTPGIPSPTAPPDAAPPPPTPHHRNPQPHLHLPRMPHAIHPNSTSTTHPLGPRRTHHHRQPRPPLPPRPHPAPPTPMEPPPLPRRRPPLDQPPRTHLHHQRHTPRTEPTQPPHPTATHDDR